MSPPPLPLLAAVLAAAAAAAGPCARAGLHADYDTDCREYYLCAAGSLAARYRCAEGLAFSPGAGACVPARRAACVRRACDPRDSLAYAAPGTSCRHYYRCERGEATEHACPRGAWFDAERQACTRGAGTCFEPLCAGLRDGEYPDASHGCRRRLTCGGGEVRAVSSCAGPCAPAERCPAPRAAAAPLPAGDADFCEDSACEALCYGRADGTYADHAADCREFFTCEAGRVTQRGACGPGAQFAGGACSPARGECAGDGRGACWGRADGVARDWAAGDCGAWLACRRERVVARGRCGARLAFDGAQCVPAAAVECSATPASAECASLPSGTYALAQSNCTRYVRCAGAARTELACGAGLMWDGARCAAAAAALCPGSCGADGRRAAADAGCRAYSVCAGGARSLYACPPGRAFDGEECVPATPAVCPRDDLSCRGRADGYHAEIESGCRRYFYCEGGDRLATLSCLSGKVFDGRACVEAARQACGAPRPGLAGCDTDGFRTVPGAGCRTYYFCLDGRRTDLACAAGQLFNGEVCVPQDKFTCLI